MALSGVSPSIPLSGMQVASQRLQAAATNTAGRATGDTRRQHVEQADLPAGGVQARLAADAPDDDPVADVIEARTAARAFAANAAVLRTSDRLIGSLLDVIA